MSEDEDLLLVCLRLVKVSYRARISSSSHGEGQAYLKRVKNNANSYPIQMY